MNDCLEDLILHRPPMLLLDEVVEAGAGRAVARVSVTSDSTFYREPDGVPAWVGIEYMAQAVAVIAGAEARRAGEDVPTGYLLGTRRFITETPWFPAASQLEVFAEEELFDDNGLGAYNCRIEMDGTQVAACRLTVYRRPKEGETHE